MSFSMDFSLGLSPLRQSQASLIDVPALSWYRYSFLNLRGESTFLVNDSIWLVGVLLATSQFQFGGQDVDLLLILGLSLGF